MAKRKRATYMTPGEQIAGTVFFVIYLLVLPFVTGPVFRFVGRLLGSAQQGGAACGLHELGLRRGVRLSHKTFGFGTVEDINITRGMFSVRFAKLGVKTFSIESLQGDIFRIL